LRDIIQIELNMGEDEVKKIALESEKVKKYMGEKGYKKIIYVRGKVLNFIV